jgi:flagellar motor switch protein FliN/FliY
MKDKKPEVPELSDMEKSAIGEICDLITSSLTKAISDKLGEIVGMTPSEVNMIELAEVGNTAIPPVLLVHLNCGLALDGQFFVFICGDGLPKIFDLAIPDDAKEAEADDEVVLKGIRAIINEALSDAMASLADSMNRKIDCSVIDAVVLQDESGFESIGFLYPEGSLLSISSALDLDGTVVNAGYLMPLSLSSQIIELLLNDEVPPADTGNASDDETEDAGLTPESEREPDIDYAAPKLEELSQAQGATPVAFGALGKESVKEGAESNISLLLDVMLDASIELGKTQMTIEEILRLSKGSVIELDKLASEPVEFLVNGKVIARGEVVVIDDNFGIRITEILSPRARLENL